MTPKDAPDTTRGRTKCHETLTEIPRGGAPDAYKLEAKPEFKQEAKQEDVQDDLSSFSSEENQKEWQRQAVLDNGEQEKSSDVGGTDKLVCPWNRTSSNTDRQKGLSVPPEMEDDDNRYRTLYREHLHRCSTARKLSPQQGVALMQKFRDLQKRLGFETCRELIRRFSSKADEGDGFGILLVAHEKGWLTAKQREEGYQSNLAADRKRFPKEKRQEAVGGRPEVGITNRKKASTGWRRQAQLDDGDVGQTQTTADPPATNDPSHSPSPNLINHQLRRCHPSSPRSEYIDPEDAPNVDDYLPLGVILKPRYGIPD